MTSVVSNTILQRRTRTKERARENERGNNSSRPGLESAYSAAGLAATTSVSPSASGTNTSSLVPTPVRLPARATLSPVSDVQSHPRFAHGAHSVRFRTVFARAPETGLSPRFRESDKRQEARDTRMRLLTVALGFLLQAWIVYCGVRAKTGRWRSCKM